MTSIEIPHSGHLAHRAPWRLAAVVVALAGLASACGGGASTVKTDETPKAVKEDIAQALGMPRTAVDAFDKAIGELGKPTPNYEAAQADLEEALASAPDFLEAHYNLGIVYERRGAYDKAIAAYQNAAKNDRLNTHSVKISLAIGRAQALAGHGEAAVTSFEEAHRLEPENIDVLNSLAAAYFKLGKNDDAIEYVKKVLREENENLTALNTLAQVYAAQDNRSMAIYVFKKAARVAIGAIKTDAELQAEPATLVLSDKINLKKANGLIGADILNNLGLMYMKMGEIPLAVANFNAASKLDPNDVESPLNMGAIYLKYLNYDGAKALFEKAYVASGGNCTSLLGRGASKYALTDLSAADDYNAYLKQCDPGSAPAHLQLERIYERAQDFPNAIIHCKAYVKIANPPDDFPVNASYCVALENMAKMSREEPKDAPDATNEEGGETVQPPADGAGDAGEGQSEATDDKTKEAAPADGKATTEGPKPEDAKP